MPRISENNPRYRLKKQICEDVAFVLNAPLRWGTKYAVLSDAVWVWSQFEGKHEGCRYWSRTALRIGNNTKKLIHEHVIPKSIIIEKLDKLADPTPAAVKRVLATCCIGVIVTRKEDQKLTAHGLRKRMPAGWDGKDVWARYRQVGIKWVDRQSFDKSLTRRSTRTARKWAIG